MDEETTTLVLRLLRDDVVEVLENQKGKQREGQLTDSQLTLLTMQMELNQLMTTHDDRRMARSISRAVNDNGIAVTVAMLEEARASDDRRLALRLAGHEDQPRPEHIRRVNVDLEDEALEKLAKLSIYEGYKESGDLEEERCGSAKSLGSEQTDRIECVACLDSKSYFDVAEVPCKHSYCRQCVICLFEDSLIDESLFPPCCCREPILLSRVRGFIGSKLAVLIERKSIE